MGNESARRLRNTARKSRRNQKGGSWEEARQRCLDFAKEEGSESEMVGTVLNDCENNQYKVIEEEEARRKAKAKAEAEAETETAKAEAATEGDGCPEGCIKAETGGKRRRSSRRRRRGRKTARKSRRKGRKSARKSRRRSRR